MVPDAAWAGSDQRLWGTAPAAGPVGPLGRPSASDPWGVTSFVSLGRPTCARVCDVLGHLAPVHGCVRAVRCVACAVSWATWLLFTGVPAWCVVWRVCCSGPLGACSPVCPLGAFLCVCGVLGHLAPVNPCVRVVCCAVCAVSWATWLLLTRVPARCVAWLVRCPGPLGSCSPVCPLSVLCCVCSVPGHLAPVHRCARSVRCFAGAVSWATWLLFTGVPARCVVLRVRCPGPLGFCSLMSLLGAFLCLCGVLSHLAPVHQCARVVCCVVCGVLGHLAPVHRCARLVRCFVGAVSWATWLLFTGVPVWCVVLLVPCPGSLGSCSPVCPFGALLGVCGVLGHLAPVHLCARSVSCFACAVSKKKCFSNALRYTLVVLEVL